MSNMEIEIFNIIGRRAPKEILKSDDMEGTISSYIVHHCQIYEIQLCDEKKCVHVSLLTDKESFEKCISEEQLLVKSNGWWTNLADKNISVFTKNSNEELLTLKLF